jgi:sentrin-specific protease 1
MNFIKASVGTFFAPFFSTSTRKRKRDRVNDDINRSNNHSELAPSPAKPSLKKRRFISAPRSSSKAIPKQTHDERIAFKNNSYNSTKTAHNNDDINNNSSRNNFDNNNVSLKQNVLESCLSPSSNEGGVISSVLTSSDKIGITKQNDTQVESLNNSTSVSKHDRRVSFGGLHSSDSSRSNNVNIISGVLKPSIGKVGLFHESPSSHEYSNIFQSSPITNTPLSPSGEDHNAHSNLSNSATSSINDNNENSILKSSISSSSPLKPEFHKAPEATYALWGNDTKNHNFNTAFNKYESAKNKQNYHSIRLQNQTNQHNSMYNMNGRRMHYQQQSYYQQRQIQQQRWEEEEEEVRRRRNYRALHHSLKASNDARGIENGRFYYHRAYQDNVDLHQMQPPSEDFLAYQELLRGKQGHQQPPLHQTIRSPQLTSPSTENQRVYDVGSRNGSNIIDIDEENEHVYDTNTGHNSDNQYYPFAFTNSVKNGNVDTNSPHHAMSFRESETLAWKLRRDQIERRNIEQLRAAKSSLKSLREQARKYNMKNNPDSTSRNVNDKQLLSEIIALNHQNTAVNGVVGSPSTTSGALNNELSKSLFTFSRNVNVKQLLPEIITLNHQNTAVNGVVGSPSTTSGALNNELSKSLFTYTSIDIPGVTDKVDGAIPSSTNINNANSRISYGNFESCVDNNDKKEPVGVTELNSMSESNEKEVSFKNKELSEPLFDFVNNNAARSDGASVGDQHVSYGNLMNFVAKDGEDEGQRTNDDASDDINSSKPPCEPIISPSDIARVEYAWNINLSEGEEVIDSSRHGFNYKNRPSIQEGVVTRKHFISLNPGNWLGDVVVNSYIAVLRNICHRNKLKIHWWNSFFFTKVYENNLFNYKNVKRWAKKQVVGGNIFDMNKMLVPVHKGFHWVLIEVDMKKNELNFYDSMVQILKSKVAIDMMDAVAQYINKEAEKRNIENLDARSWKMTIVTTSPQQTNGCDCGVFMLQTGRALMNINPGIGGIYFHQGHMDYYRYLIGASLIEPRKYSPKSIKV